MDLRQTSIRIVTQVHIDFENGVYEYGTERKTRT